MTGKRSVPCVPKVALLLESSSEYGRALLRGVARYARLHGPWFLYGMPEYLNQALPKGKSWDTTGLIACIRAPQAARLIRSTGLPFVACSRDGWNSVGGQDKFCEVRTNPFGIAQIAAAHLLERGFRRFAFCGFGNRPWSLLREQAFSKFLQGRGLDCRTHHVQLVCRMRQSNWTRTLKRALPALTTWLASLPKPVGVMACNDECGREVLQACTAAELRVPDEVAVVGVDNDEMLCELSSPPLSSVALDLEHTGYEAARILDGLMSGKLKGRYLLEVEPVSVIARRSTDVIAQDDPVVITALRFIRDHAGKLISVTEVVEEAGVSRRTLERRFMRAIGRPILSEITHCRVDRAKHMLLETNVPCYQVAMAVGFSSLKTFYRAFRRAEGVSPRSFRQGFGPLYGGRCLPHACPPPDPARAGPLQHAQGGGRTGFRADQRATRLSKILAAGAGQWERGMEADLRYPQSAETLPLRIQSAEGLKTKAERKRKK